MEKREKRKRRQNHQVMDKKMKGKVIKEKSDDRWRQKRILKEISKKKKIQNKKNYFAHKMIFKNHKRREKEEKKKTERKEEDVSPICWKKKQHLFRYKKARDKKGERFFFSKKIRTKKKTIKESHKKTRNNFSRHKQKTKHGQTKCKKKCPAKEGTDKIIFQGEVKENRKREFSRSVQGHKTKILWKGFWLRKQRDNKRQRKKKF